MKSSTRLFGTAPLIAIAIAALVQSAAAQSSDERAIRAASTQWQQDIVAQNVDKIAAVYAPDAIVLMANTPAVKDPSAIRSGWVQMVKTPGLDLRWTPVKVEVTSPTSATEYGTYTESHDGPNGKVSDAGNYVTLWHKVNGQWRVGLDATISSAAPAASAAPVALDLGDEQLIGNDKVTWTDFSAPGFDPGVKLAVLHGNPMGKGDYTLRLKFPDGYKFPVHWHPGAEHVTVVSGTFLLAMGSSGDWSQVQSYAPGSFVYAPARHPHYGGARGETVVQLHGEGPFAINLGAPK
jgi:ketosteroid isomerase-like protein/quercetin dioxygenase-like cupin family protein